jgi:hypothetical protein
VWLFSNEKRTVLNERKNNFHEEKHTRLADPVVTAGDRVYCICSQNGLFPDPWGGHVPHEGWGVWNHPIKLLDGFWLALRPRGSQATTWLSEADACRVYGAYTEFEYRVAGLRVVRRDFAPDGVEGLTVTLHVEGANHLANGLEMLALFRSDLRPAWLGEEVGLEDAPDTVAAAEGGLIFGDERNPWAVAVGADTEPQEVAVGDAMLAGFTPGFTTAGQGVAGGMRFSLETGDGGAAALALFIAGSAQSADAAAGTLAHLRQEHTALLAAKIARYQEIAEHGALASPEADLDRAFCWAKLNSQMLAREVPDIGRGAGAGLPTYPWWFGIDVEYAILPMLQSGHFELCMETLRLLKRASLAKNNAEPGRVIHEITTTGVVYNAGNLIETPLFTRAVHQCFQWTGDHSFLAEMYNFCKEGLLDYTLDQCDPDGDLCPSGRSIIETLEMHAGFECIDCATYTWEALLRLHDMAQVMGDNSILPTLEAKAAELARRIREEWWIEEEGLFADVRASVTEVRERLVQVAEHAAQSKHPGQERQARQAHEFFASQLAVRKDAPPDIDLHWLLRHWVIACPVEAGLATPDQAQRTLARLESSEFSGEWGMYLHPRRHSVMTINTGVLAMAEARYGRVDQAHKLVRKLVDALPYHMPGAISEALPDQWCFLQLWSALGMITPIVECFLGVAPEAHSRQLRVTPHLPPAWDHASLQQLRVGADTFDIRVRHDGGERRVQVRGPEDYALTIGCCIPESTQVREVALNGEPVSWRKKHTVSGSYVICEATGSADLRVRFS